MTRKFERGQYPDKHFMTNVREARDLGMDLVCSQCGCGISDDTDSHDTFCPEYPEVEAQR